MKKMRFGFGTVFSFIVVYFIYLYSKDKNWAFLAFISKWYLIIVGGIFVLILAITLLIILLTFLAFCLAFLKGKKSIKKKQKKDFLDAEYNIRE